LPIDRRYLRRMLIVVGCLVASPRPALVWASMPLFVAGGALHLWSKGCLEQNRRLTTAGPYRFVRNPFYVANALVDLATCLVIGRVGVAAVFAALWWTTYRATIRAEEERLAQLFAAAYHDYAARVPRLLPDGRRLSADRVTGAFSLTNPGLSQGREYARLLGVALGPLAIGAAYRVRSEGRELLAPEGALTLACIVTVAALWVVKLALAEVFRRPGHALLPGLRTQGARIGLALVLAALAFPAAASRPWLAVLPALWATIAGLDAFRAARVGGRAPGAAVEPGRWAYLGNAALGSLGAALLLWLVPR